MFIKICLKAALGEKVQFSFVSFCMCTRQMGRIPTAVFYLDGWLADIPLHTWSNEVSCVFVSAGMAKRVKSTSMTLKDFYEKVPGEAPLDTRLPSKPGFPKNG